MSRVMFQNIFDDFGSEENIIRNGNDKVIAKYFLAKNSVLASYNDHPLADWHRLTYFYEKCCSEINSQFEFIKTNEILSMEYEMKFSMNSNLFIDENIFKKHETNILFSSITQALAFYKATFFFDWERGRKICQGQFPSIGNFEMHVNNFENHVWDFNKITILETIIKNVISQIPEFERALKASNKCLVFNNENNFWGTGDKVDYTVRNVQDRNNYYGKLLTYLKEN